MNAGRRSVGPTERIYEWLESHPDTAQQDALLVWVRAVAQGYELLITESFCKAGTNRLIHTSRIPGADTTAVFIAVDTPARAIHILRFDDHLV